MRPRPWNGSMRTWVPAALGRFPGRGSSGREPQRNSSGLRLPARGSTKTAVPRWSRNESPSNTRSKWTASSSWNSEAASGDAPSQEDSSIEAVMARGYDMAKPAKILLNVPAIKADFPILQRTVRDKRLVYLDSAATSQKPKQVIDATSDFYSRYNANVHRAIYELGEEATREYEGAREKVAAIITAQSPSEIAFTKSTTESLNLVAYGYGVKGKIQKGDEIVGTVMEHHSNHVPWHFVKDHKGAVLKYVDVNDDGTLKIEQYDELLTKRTKIVTVTLCSNVLGTINPVKEIAKRAHEVGAICVVDAAQAAPHMPIDVQSLDADFLAFSGHKMLGPTGIGVLYGKQELFEATEPLLGGGEMIREVHLA